MHNKNNVSSGLSLSWESDIALITICHSQQVVKKFEKFDVLIALLLRENTSSTNNTKVFML